MVEPHAVLEVPDGVLHLGVAAVVGLQFQGIALPVSDEGVIAVVGEESQLGSGGGPHPSDDEPYRCSAGLILERCVFRLGHVGPALHPVGYGLPVRLGYALYEIAEVPAQTDGDGEADIRLAADLDHGVGIEAAVGPHREWSLGPSVAYSADGLPQEVGGAPGGVGPSLPQPGHQHLAGASGHGDEGVIAPSVGVAVVAGALLVQAVGLADGGINIDGQGSVARPVASGPGAGQQLPAHTVQLADVAPAEAAQEGAQSGRSFDHAPQDAGRPATAQCVSVVDADAASQGGGHQGQQLVAGVGPTWGVTQVEVPVNQLRQAQAESQSGGQQKPGIGHQAVVIKGDLDAVGVLKW